MKAIKYNQETLGERCVNGLDTRLRRHTLVLIGVIFLLLHARGL